MKSLEKIYAALSLTGFSEAMPFIEKELNEYKNYETNKFSLSEKTKSKIAERWKFAFEEFGY